MHAQGTAVPAAQGTAPAGESRRIAYTVAEVAGLLRKHPNTVYEWVRKGSLPAERVGGTIFIPVWALARLTTPATGPAAPVAPVGGEAA